MSRILITGASGSMGHYLAQYIRSLGEEHEVWGLGRRAGVCAKAIGLDRYVGCDLTVFKALPTQLFVQVQFDVVFHLASVADVRRSFGDPAVYLNNVECTVRLFEAVKNSGRPWPKVVLCSTSEVYGNVLTALNPISEGQGYVPVNPYAASKVTQEVVAETYQRVHGFNLVITRAFGYINPLRADLVAAALARQVLAVKAGEAVTVVHGDLSPVRTFADARDVAEAYWLAGTRCSPGAYNIGSEEPCSIARLLELIEAQARCAAPHEQVERLVRPTDIFTCVPNTAKFRAATGWQPIFSLQESVTWLVEELSRC